MRPGIMDFKDILQMILSNQTVIDFVGCCLRTKVMEGTEIWNKGTQVELLT